MGDKIKVLFVEDDPDDVALTLRAMKEVLKSAEIVVACDGVEALGHLLGDDGQAETSGKKKPDAVILDLNLPRISGIELLQRLNAAWGPGLRGVKIAVLSSAPAEQYRPILAKLGVTLHLQKPISHEQSSAMVAELTKMIFGAPIRL